ncbi:hypothetical protein FIV00_14905 [Labrenzia sp. THAF82]|uniref:hypothetical protein n=1 Tax=Labrenzia sp. THAF82 TaxID=2587861 RepID=UPI0012693A71|nr:hypothetical protein [Labrenzia sp. THAF82]QFT31779.1 hypothetical protein FIV00_14905 [Labrenzia sp. THAF82]
METLLEIIRTLAPWLWTVIGLCLIVLVATMICARAAALKAADSEFGNWPDKTPSKKPRTSPAPAGSTMQRLLAGVASRVSLGLAVGIVAGQALFWLFPRGF